MVIDSKSCKNCSKGKKCEEHSYKKQDTFREGKQERIYDG